MKVATKPPPKFCRMCGRKMEKILDAKKYDAMTGEPTEQVVGFVCPTRFITHDTWYWNGGYYVG